MTTKLYSEVSQETISQLKGEGYTSVELVLLDLGNPYQATIEIIPGKRKGFEMNSISLDSNEIGHYFDDPSPMAKYVIDQDYLRTALHY